MSQVFDWIKKEKYKFLWIALSIYSGASLCYLLNLMCQNISFSFSCFAIPLFAVVLWLVKQVLSAIHSDEDKKGCLRRSIYSVVLGSLMGISYVMGYQLVVLDMTLPGFKGKFFVLLVGLFTFCLLLFFISQHEKVKIEMKWFLRIIIVFFIICFILATITEFTGN